MKYLYATLILLALAIGYYLGRTLDPKIETQIEEVEVIKRDIVTIIKEVTRTDGTKDTTTTIVDRSKERKETDIHTTETIPASQNKIAVAANTSQFRDIDSYTFSYERRLIGPVWLGAQYNTKQVYGLSLGLEF